ncbi:hypothetical protein ABPG75_013402 [Micractinium tetrahymenae]
MRYENSTWRLLGARNFVAAMKPTLGFSKTNTSGVVTSSPVVCYHLFSTSSVSCSKYSSGSDTWTLLSTDGALAENGFSPFSYSAVRPEPWQARQPAAAQPDGGAPAWPWHRHGWASRSTALQCCLLGTPACLPACLPACPQLAMAVLANPGARTPLTPRAALMFCAQHGEKLAVWVAPQCCLLDLRLHAQLCLQFRPCHSAGHLLLVVLLLLQRQPTLFNVSHHVPAGGCMPPRMLANLAHGRHRYTALDGCTLSDWPMPPVFELLRTPLSRVLSWAGLAPNVCRASSLIKHVRYDGSAWAAMPSPFNSTSYSSSDAVVDSQGRLIWVVDDSRTSVSPSGQGISAFAFDGSSWSALGPLKFSLGSFGGDSSPRIVMAGSVPYVLFKDGTGKSYPATLMKFSL